MSAVIGLIGGQASTAVARDFLDQIASLPEVAGNSLLKGSAAIQGSPSSTLTGSIDPAASTAVVGVGTLFTSELKVGDRITVSGETRTVISITNDLNLTVDVAFSDNANDPSPTRLPALFALIDSAGVLREVHRSDSVRETRDGASVKLVFDPDAASAGKWWLGAPGVANQLVLGYGGETNNYISAWPPTATLNLGLGQESFLAVSGKIIQSTSTGIIAGTTQTQAGATALVRDRNFIGTCVNSGDGVKLLSAVDGLKLWIYNGGAQPARIWPALDDDLGAGVNAADTKLLPVGQSREYIAKDVTTWVSDSSLKTKVVYIAAFSYDVSGTIDFDALLPGDIITEVEVTTTTIFDDPAAILTVGTVSLGGAALMPSNASDLTALGTYKNDENTILAVGDTLRYILTPGISTQGAGRISIIVLRS